MTIKEQIEKELLQARINDFTDAKNTLQLVKAAIQNKEIEKHGEVTDEDVIALLQKEIKQTNEAKEYAIKMNRDDLANEATRKIGILRQWVPTQLTESQILDLLIDKGAKKGDSIGKLMGLVMSTHKSVVDGNIVRKVIQANF